MATKPSLQTSAISPSSPSKLMPGTPTTSSRSPVDISAPSWFTGTFSVGVAEDENSKYRNAMEDTYSVIYDFGSPESFPGAGTTSLTLGPPHTHHSLLHSHSVNSPFVPAAPGTTIGSNSSGHVPLDAGYFAVFDGHAGKYASEWCGKRMHIVLEEQIRKDPHASIPEVLDRAFTEADAILAKQPIRNAGCTAIVALMRWEDRIANTEESAKSNGGSSEIGTTLTRSRTVDSAVAQLPEQVTPQHLYHHYHLLHHHNKRRASVSAGEVAVARSHEHTVRERILYTANAGDSRIVLCRRGRALRLSYDHKGTDPVEAQRIKNSGGMVLNGRVNGILAVTRALGDCYIKKLVTSHPYTTETYLIPDDEFMILACDGLWDVCTDQEAINLVRNISDPEEASKTLIKYALEHFSMDNLTVMVVRFDERMGGMIRKFHGMDEIVSEAPRRPSKGGTAAESPIALPKTTPGGLSPSKEDEEAS
ncbi:phosphatase 2C-like domain-containing protein [Lipomyces oligophaga]|uniref:phosphatase 2C-like domain-containing protein n=1 Tax=Lipomyces oligophaga TaxID=45792 RepID=UPI0034CFF9C8